jgi:hypothetical protein
MRLVPVFVALALCACPDAWAFTPRTRVLIVQRALTLMPDSVQTQMKRHARPLFRGALEGAEEIGPEGVDVLDPGAGDETLEAAVSSAVAALDRQEPMAEVAREMGAIARAATDLSFALNVGPSDPREKSLYMAYARFVESRHERIVVTFGGFPHPELAEGDLRGFAQSVAAEARRDYAGILRSYYPEGRSSVPGDFDDRSVAFATASLGISRAVTATARAWLYAWHRAHGDLAGSPGITGDHPFGEPAAQARERAQPTEASDHQPQEERR